MTREDAVMAPFSQMNFGSPGILQNKTAEGQTAATGPLELAPAGAGPASSRRCWMSSRSIA